MKKIILPLILSTTLSASSVYAAHSEFGDFNIFANHFMNKSVKKISNRIDLLFVENADNASIEPDLSKKNCMIVKFWPITHGVQYFTNEPVRLSGVISPKDFVQFWHEQGAKNHPFIPNVDIEGITANHKHYDQPAALGRARYDSHHKVMSYIACPLKNQKLTVVPKMHLASIFFDGFYGFPPI